MSNPQVLVTVASWEPRFELGSKRLLQLYDVRKIILFFFEEFAPRTEPSRKKVHALAEAKGIDVVERRLKFDDPLLSWQMLKVTVEDQIAPDASVLVDISTMPREIIWATFFWLEYMGSSIHYAYHRPESYGSDWLARDPNEPRLVYKMAGTAKLGHPTALIIVTGYDVDRTSQAIEYFQPQQTALIAQKGDQYENDLRNIDVHLNLAKTYDLTMVDADLFSDDHGHSIVRNVAEELVRKYNVLMFSFGPKVSAIALYRAKREFSDSGLGFIHCKDYSADYSQGIADTIRGAL